MECAMKKICSLLSCVLCLFILSGCSKSTGVMPWGEGQYSVSVDLERALLTSPTDAERIAYKEASAYCAEVGQEVAVDVFQHKTFWRHYTVKLVFRCLSKEAESKAPYEKINIEML